VAPDLDPNATDTSPTRHPWPSAFRYSGNRSRAGRSDQLLV